LGLRWLGRVLYPDLFPEPLGPVVAAFFEMFYHRRPSDAEIAPFVRSSEPA
jgi:iron complex transport system substrate-binding protein